MRILPLPPLKTVLALILLIVLAGAGYGAWYALSPLSVSKLPVEVEVARGTGFRAAVDQLERAGIAIHRREFELLDRLTRGDVAQAEIRLIEGWTFAQFRAALNESADLRHDSVELDDAQILVQLDVPEEQPEGLFFPDTYLFARGSSDMAVLRRAYRGMQRHLKTEWEARNASLPYRTPYEALIMASIIEKETGLAAERDMIAGVLVNRLRIGMRLQADPTVIYGLGDAFDGNLKKKHLLEDGPYNTYTRAGLPPTPIAMPGLASLKSALRPAKTDSLYYVSRGDGSSHFSRNIDEHNRAVSKYQRGGR